jgi:hypothetical protein
MNGVEEMTTPFRWGAADRQLRQRWSIRNATSGYAYPAARDPGGSNVDVFVFQGLKNPEWVSNAELFPYSEVNALQFAEGDTVFFRGIDSVYGAWRIDDIIAPPGFTGATLVGRWYYQSDGRGNFTVPEPASMLALTAAGLMLRRRR